jgi:hypothetical protein
MANMCSNWVEIYPCVGGEEQAKKLFALIGEEFDFEKVIPLEENERGGDKWGCNSIAFDVDYHEQCEDHHEWYFWTKWCPPKGIYDKLTEMFPDVFIYWRYEEPGCGLYGYLNEEDY